ncbi:WbqC family protein [Cytobacillus sp. Hm23]
MKLAIMQPYLFPYISYFQLIHAVDQFVVYDDVQYINRGFINRNRILLNNNAHLFTFSVKKAPRHYKINERHYSGNFYTERDTFLKTIERAYKKSNNFIDIYNLLSACLNIDIENYNVAQINERVIKQLCEFLDINTQFKRSSSLNIKSELKGHERILAINLALESSHYINSIGGKSIYSKEYFSEFGINMSFLEAKKMKYNQKSKEFIENLSIIDILMFNPKEEIKKKYLNHYELI